MISTWKSTFCASSAVSLRKKVIATIVNKDFLKFVVKELDKLRPKESSKSPESSDQASPRSLDAQAPPRIPAARPISLARKTTAVHTRESNADRAKREVQQFSNLTIAAIQFAKPLTRVTR